MPLEILYAPQTMDALIIKALAELLPSPPALVEDDSNRRASYQIPVTPSLRVPDGPTYFGLRPIVKFLFIGTPHFPADKLSIVESLISLGDLIYAAAVPIIAKGLSILISPDRIESAVARVHLLAASAAPLLAGDSHVGVVYFQTIINIIASFGISVPLPTTIVNIEGLGEDAITFAHDVLGVPEHYAMSPPPAKKILYTTPIYYVNGLPHIGHIFTTTFVDTLVKWYRLRQIPIIYSSGTDEHGIKVQTTAQSNGYTPEAWCDKTVQGFLTAFDDFDLHPDDFIRTTEPRHLKIATALWEILAEKGYIYKGSYEGWYSKTEESFVPDKDVQEVTVDGVTKRINANDGAELIWSSETNYMFKLTAMRDAVLAWLDANPTAIIPRCYYNNVRATLVAGLHDLSISRQNVSWGIPVPGDPSQTMYVWIDALANYLTVAGWNKDDNGIWPADCHVIGKDILKFHGIYWPAFLIAAGIEPCKQLLVHGWWTLNDQKMSKSIGNTLDPYQLKEFWGLEPIKYFLLREVTLTSDSDYSMQAMLSRYNGDLADTLGNIVMRIISPKLNPSMLVPQAGELTEADRAIIADIETLPGTVDHNIALGRTRIALAAIWERLRALDKYLTDQAPWKLVTTDPVRGATVSYVLIDLLRIVVLCLWPFISKTAETILQGLGVPQPLANDPEVMFKFGLLKPGTQITAVPPLFPKKSETGE
jgi:methionyl-tRNA synthetase